MVETEHLADGTCDQIVEAGSANMPSSLIAPAGSIYLLRTSGETGLLALLHKLLQGRTIVPNARWIAALFDAQLDSGLILE